MSVRTEHRGTLLIGTLLWCAGCAGLERPTSDQSRLPMAPASVASNANLESAEARLRDYLLEQPRDPAGYRELGIVYLDQRRWYAATKALETASSLDPNDAKSPYWLARALDESGRPGEALAAAEKATRLDPGLGKAHALVGRLLRSAGRNREANSALEAGWHADPPSVEAGYLLAQWDLDRDRARSAADRLKLCLIYEPDHVGARTLYAGTLERLGQVAEAKEQWQYLVDRGRTGAEAYAHLAALCMREGDTLSAERYVSAARRLEPNHGLLSRLEPMLAQQPEKAPKMGNDNYPPLRTLTR